MYCGRAPRISAAPLSNVMQSFRMANTTICDGNQQISLLTATRVQDSTKCVEHEQRKREKTSKRVNARYIFNIIHGFVHIK